MPNAKGYSGKINGVRLISDFIEVTADISSNGVCDGTITINASNGQAPYEYSIDNGATFHVSNVFTGLCEKGYFIVVRDKNKNRGRAIGMLFDQLPCGVYKGLTLQDLIDLRVRLGNVLDCTLNDFIR